MRQRNYLIAIMIASLIGQTAFPQGPLPRPEVSNRIEFRTLQRPPRSLSWNEAIARGAISLESHEIAPQDTYTSVIEQYGIRPDPNSIELYRQINEDRYPVRQLPLKKKLSVVVARQPLVVSINSDLKAQIESKELALRNRRHSIRVWMQKHPGSGTVEQARDFFGNIVTKIQQLKMTGYALDRSVLASTNEALQEATVIVDDLVTRSRLPTEGEVTLLQVIDQTLSRLVTAARDTDAPKIEAKVVTRDRVTGEEEDLLNVCFKPALKLLVFRYQNPNREPAWRCDDAFDTMSSPAKRLFKRDLKYVIWAVKGTARVSVHRIITIEPNMSDGTFRHELEVDKG